MVTPTYGRSETVVFEIVDEISVALAVVELFAAVEEISVTEAVVALGKIVVASSGRVEFVPSNTALVELVEGADDTSVVELEVGNASVDGDKVVA